MAVDTFSCPECSVKLRRSPQLRTGARVQCPKCSLQFVVPPEDEQPPADDYERPRPGINSRGEIEREAAPRRQPEQHVRDQYEDDRGPGRFRDERNQDDQPGRRRITQYDEDYPSEGGGPIGRPEDLRNDYEVDIGKYFTVGFKHWSAIMGPFIGYALLLLLLSPILIFTGPFLLPHLFIGPFIVALAQLKGKPWTFGDFFGGFNYYVPVLVFSLLQGLIFFVCLLPAILAFVVFIVIMEASRGKAGVAVVLPIGAYLLCYIALIYFNVRLHYAPFLILDRRFSAMDAIKGSWKLTKNRFWITLVIILLLGIINSVGVSLCYVGVLFSMPLFVTVSTASYLLIAGTQPPVMDEDEPPRRRRQQRDDRDDF